MKDTPNILPEEADGAHDSDLDCSDDPVDEAPFTAEELLRLARELLPS